MKRRAIVRPTDAELEILGVLWELREASVRELHRVLARTKSVGYTTVLKLIQIMTAKGLVTKRDDVRPQIYSPTFSEQEMQRHLASDLVRRAFRGSAHKLVMQALSVQSVSDEEIEAIKKLLNNRGGKAS
ncbi:MAG: BlaI/MecI/CopY family transcriptional regulator [Candidatus Hydrogenedentes bacterium]|nr:BlaI/MecI/CopY family transcriptional regulator [Candidatus Hydrogenedentota bacterium]